VGILACFAERPNKMRIKTIVVLLIVLAGCASTQTQYEREYRRIWREMIKSEAWANSLAMNTVSSQAEKLPENEAEAIKLAFDAHEDAKDAVEPVSQNPSPYSLFFKDYDTMVSQAYFSILAQAEEADERLELEYRNTEIQAKDPHYPKDEAFDEKRKTIMQRYQAHRKMLEGLKAWDIFSERRSGDLRYFKAENLQEVYAMKMQNQPSDKIVDFLVYKLADLYHFE